jgi:transposase-like protein
VIHLVRNALRPVARRDAAQVAAGLRTIYTAPTPEAAFDALAAFAASPWGTRYPQAARVFEDAGTRLHPVPGVQPGRPQAALHHQQQESLNWLRKVTKARGPFPNDDAVVKPLWLAIINIEDKRARERAARRQATGKRSDQPARLVEGSGSWAGARRSASSTTPTQAA